MSLPIIGLYIMLYFFCDVWGVNEVFCIIHDDQGFKVVNCTFYLLKSDAIL